MVNINHKGLTLLEVLITLGILSIIIISFITLFTSTNLTLNYSAKKVNAIVEVKSILDNINSNVKKEDINTMKSLVKEIIEEKYESDYKMFQDEDRIYRYEGKTIHCLIKNREIDIDSILNHIMEIKIVLFYNEGNNTIDLSTYLLMEEI